MLESSLLLTPEHDSCGTGFVANILGYKSHSILEKGIEAVINLTHRGAVSADGKTGDGAGLLTQVPHKIFHAEILSSGRRIPESGDLAVAMVFFPQNDFSRQKCRHFFEETASRYGLELLGWRKVPVRDEALGEKAFETRPVIEQFLVARKGKTPKKEFERLLFIVRKEVEAMAMEHSFFDLHIASFSSRTIVYKGFMLASQLPEYYLDLKNPDYETSLVIYHQRFSTNTQPSWRLAQPFRTIAHNGEINTIAGNRNWMRAREPDLLELPWAKRNSFLKPVIMPEGSDSFSFDNAIEVSLASGREILHTLAMLMPEAWEKDPQVSPDLKGFYEFHNLITEPWDGPAAIAFSDGKIVGAILDRNGLRPARYIVTDDDLMIMGSEVGIVEVDESHILRKGRLGPGMMIAVDTESGRLLENDEIKSMLAARRPYRQWVEQNRKILASYPKKLDVPYYRETLPARQRAFGLTEEEIQLVIRTMAVEGKDPVFSMGDDTPLAVLSRKPRRLYQYFKQLFAQVTNPPIDPIREEMVMSLKACVGPRLNYFQESPEHARRLMLASPILLPEEFEEIRNFHYPELKTITLPATFDAADGADGIEDTLLILGEAACKAVMDGCGIIILSDEEIDSKRAPIPMLVAVAAVHHHLMREGLRMKCSIIAETGDAFDIHHFACLAGYGAAAFYPYLVYETIQDQIEKKYIQSDPQTAFIRYRNAANHGLLKIMSKMGISTYSSYQSAQIFEAIGLRRSTINRYFTGTPCRVGGIGLYEVVHDVLQWHREAFLEGENRLPLGGYYRFRRGEEFHAFNPDVVKAVHAYTKSGEYDDYKKYESLVNQRPPTCLRDLLEFKKTKPIPFEEVEPVESILKRLNTASISFGALSQEAHETLAIAMNRMGAKSGSGEGGEDPVRYRPLPNGDSKNSRIKQVASGRFGVTTEYLVRADELEIKMAQGSKPGEGGQLPGHKVTSEIARVRHAQPGVTLISPPPHHDIYSIEDLKQLIYDLKQVNPAARVSVKLVSEFGVGTIASGVVKAHADTILISGHEGGTGASPMSSIKNAGSAWELGLAETQQTLVMNGLRSRVLIRVDGGMKSGRDVVIAALLGAEEYGFGTAPLIAEGCVMARQCHLNTCPVGITTHDPTLRAKYSGTPERIIRFFYGVAGEVREILGQLGFRSLEEIVGRVDLLKPKNLSDHPKALYLDLAPILREMEAGQKFPQHRLLQRNDPPVDSLSLRVLGDADDAIQGKHSMKLSYPIRNIHRSIGACVAGEIARRYGDKGLPSGIELECLFQGHAGQSFGAFLVPGMRWILQGDANDYVGKGMTGGEIAIRSDEKTKFTPHANVIAGNTLLYGATGGSLFAAGRVGERFCVRNSGAKAVVEGIGDHGCEYMTGGVVIVLGPVGRNFGAGMSGGIAFIFDEERQLELHLNQELVTIGPFSQEWETIARALIQRHFQLTGSPLADRILKKWSRTAQDFRVVHPKDLKVVQHLTAAIGLTDEPTEEVLSARA
ncbi:MAG: glutamate synthase large subunit [Deltaproteobacteria bacterium]|nr:glutamate synthase large subunit [Deltaproteobacteria bacterium]